MATDRDNTPLNPTVEEVQDETSAGVRQGRVESRFSWSQICSQHDSVLSSHLETLQALKGEISSDAEASKVIATMIERTQKLVTQFEGIKNHIIPRATRNNGRSRTSSSELNGASNTGKAAASKSEDSAARKRRKRNRISNEASVQASPEPQPQPKEPVVEVQRMKRKRTELAIPGSNEDVQNVMPVSLETEDISDEVQRRLKIKEENRRKRDAGGKPEKRKRDRDSLASNASASSFNSSKPRKKVRLGEPVNR
ncbi:hypothetical protein BDV18DRAFT_135602 [Aspergillus unguis]